MFLREVTELDLGTYTDWLCSAVNGHLLQSVNWSKVKREDWRSRFFMVIDNEEIIGSFCVLIRKLPIINKSFIYIPRGPVLKDTLDFSVWKFIKDEIIKIGKAEDALFIKIDPQITDARVETFLKELGFQSKKDNEGFGGIQPASTTILDISNSDENILSNFSKGIRYNIKYPSKKGVTYINTGIEGIEDFSKIMKQTAIRGEFTTRNQIYYKRLFELLGEDVSLIIGYYDNKPITGGITVVYGNKSWALYGGASSEHRNLKAYHGLIWERILWSKSRGADSFDFHGIPVDRAEESCKNSKEYGIYQFKKSFGGDEYDFIGEFDLPLNIPLYHLSQKGIQARSLMNKLKKKIKNQ
ncbi:peptidoglycan bridge formation glycyltransferase FemA/FemB family protein [Alkalicella caledoniensis]|uniref:Peptidoglycan bridge formation glycyltransferase FemA/FemB family protein n=1 Tax=Alkalicella caledoniensis TaxID=2731377 RepID=A0A7G9WBS2_ALKCA|nr:peptidoglycan bridge formation glycyltransferase FemA/FemB family protein [Alkalicella caledoniensis]QNO16134.1 peptidoglycan bridge formation glycyltransferase FemA/FemB family protein [Alkalicella caledoniensis]